MLNIHDLTYESRSQKLNLIYILKAKADFVACFTGPEIELLLGHLEVLFDFSI